MHFRLRGLKPLALHWLSQYDTRGMKADLDGFHKTLSANCATLN